MAYLETNIPRKRRWPWLVLIVIVVLAIVAAVLYQSAVKKDYTTPPFYDDLAEYHGEPVAEVNGGLVFFEAAEITDQSFEKYSKLDKLGRCGVAVACLSTDTMPTEERGDIGMIKPAGWHTVRYDDLIEDKYLYNRCHLIAFMLSGENANVQNLITGTRYLNVTGMLPYEIKVARYIESTGNHVMYRVTPVYVDSELVARGVLMEAYSVEDEGKGLQFNVFAYNVQPGIEIDYATGDSSRAD